MRCGRMWHMCGRTGNDALAPLSPWHLAVSKRSHAIWCRPSSSSSPQSHVPRHLAPATTHILYACATPYTRNCIVLLPCTHAEQHPLASTSVETTIPLPLKTAHPHGQPQPPILKGCPSQLLSKPFSRKTTRWWIKACSNDTKVPLSFIHPALHFRQKSVSTTKPQSSRTWTMTSSPLSLTIVAAFGYRCRCQITCCTPLSVLSVGLDICRDKTSGHGPVKAILPDLVQDRHTMACARRPLCVVSPTVTLFIPSFVTRVGAVQQPIYNPHVFQVLRVPPPKLNPSVVLRTTLANIMLFQSYTMSKDLRKSSDPAHGPTHKKVPKRRLPPSPSGA